MPKPAPMPLPRLLRIALNHYREEQMAGRDEVDSLEDVEAGAAHSVCEDLVSEIEKHALGQERSDQFIEAIHILNRALNELKAI